MDKVVCSTVCLSVCSGLVYECRSQVKAISPVWFGPQVLPLLHVILPGWTNSSGQEEEERRGKDWGVRSGDCHTLLCGRLGGPDAGGSVGAFFLSFWANRMGTAVVVWGASLLWDCTGPHLSNPLLLSHKTAVTHSHAPILPSPLPDQLEAWSVL